jgi:hypothetical protein
MVDLMPTLHGPPSRTSGTASPSSSRTCSAVVGLIRPKRLADGAAMPALAGDRGEAAQQFERHRMPGHAQADGVLAAGHGVRHPGLLFQDQGQRAGPEGFHQLPGDGAPARPSGRRHRGRPDGRSAGDRPGGPWRRILATAAGLAASAPGRRPSRSGWRPVRRRAAGRRHAGNQCPTGHRP